MKEYNPFLYNENPYRVNPFTVLEVTAEDNQAMIEQFARAGEATLASGGSLDPELNLIAGACNEAAEKLQNPVLRLAFDLMLYWSERDNEV